MIGYRDGHQGWKDWIEFKILFLQASHDQVAPYRCSAARTKCLQVDWHSRSQ